MNTMLVALGILVTLQVISFELLKWLVRNIERRLERLEKYAESQLTWMGFEMTDQDKRVAKLEQRENSAPVQNG